MRIGGRRCGKTPSRTAPVRAKAPKKKKAVNLTIDAELLAEAKAAGTNLSNVLETALKEQLKQQRWQKWREDNRAAIEASNAQLERDGLWFEPDWLANEAQFDVCPAPGRRQPGRRTVSSSSCSSEPAVSQLGNVVWSRRCSHRSVSWRRSIDCGRSLLVDGSQLRRSRRSTSINVADARSVGESSGGTIGESARYRTRHQTRWIFCLRDSER